MNASVPSEARHFLVLPAAGSGQRMGAPRPKQYLEVNGATVLQHTLQRLGNMGCFERITLVLGADDAYWPAVAARLPLEQVAEGYHAMDERRAIKTLLVT